MFWIGLVTTFIFDLKRFLYMLGRIFRSNSSNGKRLIQTATSLPEAVYSFHFVLIFSESKNSCDDTCCL